MCARCPQAFEADSGRPPSLQPGGDFYRLLFSRFMERCTDLERDDLAAYLRWEKRGEIRVATACSGTDVPLLVYAGFAEAARDILSVPLRIVHRFSCERDTAKQRFLTQMYPTMRHFCSRTPPLLELSPDMTS